MLEGIRLVIYDLDGTLIDSREAIITTFNEVLSEMGARERPASFIEPMIGLPLVEMFRKALPPERHGEVQWCWDRYVEIYDGLAPRTTLVLPGVPEALGAIEARGLTQCVATTKRGDVASRLLTALGLRHHFALVLGINDVQHPKPAPDIIMLTLSRLGLAPETAVFVEDTVIGLRAGRDAGVRTVGVTTGTGTRAELESFGPDLVIDSLSELPGAIS